MATMAKGEDALTPHMGQLVPDDFWPTGMYWWRAKCRKCCAKISQPCMNKAGIEHPERMVHGVRIRDVNTDIHTGAIYNKVHK